MDIRREKNLENISRGSNIWLLGAPELENKTNQASKSLKQKQFMKMSRIYISKLKEILNASVQFSSVAQSCPTLCNPMNHRMPGLPIYNKLN